MHRCNFLPKCSTCSKHSISIDFLSLMKELEIVGIREKLNVFFRLSRKLIRDKSNLPQRFASSSLLVSTMERTDDRKKRFYRSAGLSRGRSCGNSAPLSAAYEVLSVPLSSYTARFNYRCPFSCGVHTMGEKNFGFFSSSHKGEIEKKISVTIFEQIESEQNQRVGKCNFMQSSRLLVFFCVESRIYFGFLFALPSMAAMHGPWQ
jgi:hypothetical protein